MSQTRVLERSELVGPRHEKCRSSYPPDPSSSLVERTRERPSTVPVKLPVHAGYEFAVPPIPEPALEESLSEKLAAWRRRKIRDLYDLHLFGHGILNEPLLRRLLVLKVWHGGVDGGLGTRPSNPVGSWSQFEIAA